MVSMAQQSTNKNKNKNGNGKLADNKSFQAELEITLAKIKTYKINCEANIVSIFWKDPQLFFDYDEINLDDFDENMWRVFYEIARGIIVVEGKETLDDITVALYLEKHLKLKDKYVEYGGYEAVEKVREYVQVHNMDGYIQELKKWNKVKQLAEWGYPVNNRLSEFVNMSLDDIYNEHEAMINHIFSDDSFAIKSYDISDGIYDNIEKWCKGSGLGLPLYGLSMLTKETGGLHKGDIILLGGVSNAGKSTFLRMTVLPSIIQKKEKIVIFLNEEGLEKWQKEMLVWIANNFYAKEMHKWQVREGKYTDDFRELLYKCAKVLEDLKQSRTITVIPLERYSTAIVAKLIKKYASMGVNYFAIDTFKMDNNDGAQVNENTRLQLVQNMTNLYNIVKESNKNLCLICTVQLTKASSKMRYLTLDAIGESKNIIDPCATGLFIRNIFEDEYTNEKRALKVYRWGGANGNTKIPVSLDKDKKYQILFIAKSRESEAGVGGYQIVLEVDFSKNILKEVGFTYVPTDF
jgi:replicative DNA helicase